MDTAHVSSNIYYYVMYNTHAIPVIDENKRSGNVPDNLLFKRKHGTTIGENERSSF